MAQKPFTWPNNARVAFVLGIGWRLRRAMRTSTDFFLSGRSLPAWVTGLAFISANLGAVEIMGMSANGAQYGMATFHYYWIGAIPAMLFLGVVMMPFYYGSKVRSVPEFMLRRFGPTAHLVNSISFALAQLLIAGVNLYLLATIVNALLGWNIWVSTVVAAVIVLSYITLGGLSAAIYTNDPKNAFRFRERVSAGMVSVNNSTSGAEAHLPFGGNGKSGNGSRQSGMWVIDQFTRWQSLNWDYAGKLQKAQMDVADIEGDVDYRLDE